MSSTMQQKLDEIRSQSVELLKWVELARSPYAQLLLSHFDLRVASARAEYSEVDPCRQGAAIEFAKIQGREFESRMFAAFLRDVENKKKYLDEQIRLCESRVQELSGGRGVEPIIEPSER